ncbi:hypothetical protein LF41_1321 [Lysobacter dokdonensis DS-58]|uniref:Transmembrane protein n=1 Tax=Lysobacter dokdonensis DS-58 TaxID=1300345 RepID=A0A0A2WKS6_9GAMM|nr:hypothetical protein [Lysobacter dokdonensis]KGQ20781.1 hypothetical protein LF41_1321 [Lysobacter dokdonensis DS-58]
MAAHLRTPGHRWRLALWTGAAALLALPAVAMRFTDEVQWTARDFITWGVMLATACGAYEVLARRSASLAYRAGAAAAIGTAFFLVWANLAVGVIGDERNPANLMFIGVLAVAVIGALLASFRAHGMARAMVATAVAQAIVGGIAIFGRLDVPVALFAITAMYVVLWMGASVLFRKAARA